jgi:signal transduction histidine kinase
MKNRWARLSPSIRIAITYLIFSTAWILCSDWLAESLTRGDEDLLKTIQHIKGLVFITASCLLLYYLSRRYYKETSNSLKQREELLLKYKALHEVIRDGIVEYNFETGITQLNEQMREYFQLAPVPGGYDSWLLQRMHPEDAPRIRKQYLDYLERKSELWQAEFRLLSKNNSYRDVTCRGYLLRNKATGSPLHMICTLQDVTEIRDVKALYYEQQLKFKQSISMSVIDAQETERNRWTQELHDNVCQVLTVAKMYLEDPRAEDYPFLDKSHSMVIQALQEIRQLSAALKPPSFDDTSLHEAIMELINNIRRVRDFQFELRIDPSSEETLRDDQKLMIYRVFQEQLNNIIKYAQAQTIRLSIEIESGNVRMDILDDGIGFNTEEIQTGIGLRNIRSRLQAHGGNLLIQSAPGEGCRLKANFSLA